MSLRKKFLLAFLVILINLFFIDVCTLKNTYGGGNGNPALLFILLLIPLLIYVSRFLLSEIPHRIVSPPAKVLTVFLSVPVIIFGFTHQREFHRSVRLQLIDVSLKKWGEVDMDYIDILTDGLTIFTNTVYFNLVTLSMFIAFIFILGVFIKKKDSSAIILFKD